ncbi:hypothetical protein V3C99_010389 [Haemonchus contortus]
MAKAQEAAQIREHGEDDLKNRLNVALEDLEPMKRAKEEAQVNINNKEKMLRKAMDTITKLETASQSSEWFREKTRMTRQIEDLQRERFAKQKRLLKSYKLRQWESVRSGRGWPMKLHVSG